ncbi:MAG: hypothetical protein D6769_00280 [Methanobacteriota archaeon]|nr:MAG: hypothetical protein D6769_00280 [Euryarchaeota archaeon]
MELKLAILLSLIPLLLISGCLEEGSSQQPLETTTLSSNTPPTTTLELEESRGRVPFSPAFTYGCSDREGNLLHCSIFVDGKELAKWDASSPNLTWPANVPFPTFTKPGNHTITMFAVDDGGLNSSTTKIVEVTPVIRVFVSDLPQGSDPAFQQSLDEAFAYWEQRLGVHFVRVPETQEHDVWVDWAKEYQGETIGRAEIGGKRAILGMGDSNCQDSYSEYSPLAMKMLAIHELGHILGYQHSNDTSDVMYPIIHNLSYSVDFNKEIVIPSYWGWWLGVCTQKDETTYEFKVTADSSVDVYIVPSSQEADNAINGKPFKYLNSCYEKSTTYFDKVCDVPGTSAIVIMNNGNDATVVNVMAQEQ